jgi:lysophospholipase L1-like esterase
MPSASRKIGFALLSVIIGLTAVELAARAMEVLWPLAPTRPLPEPGAATCLPDCMPGLAAMPEQPEGLPRGIPMVPHGRRAWALPPNTEMVETNVAVRVNSLALRGPELGAKAASELRLLTLGDSSVFGFGVRESAVFSSVAASQLSEAWERPVTPVIGATPGYTSVQALHTLQDVGRAVQPDIVVIATLWSDLFQSEVPLERAGGQTHPLAAYRITTRLLAPWLPAPTVGWIDGDVGESGRARVGLEQYTQTLDQLVAEVERLGARPMIMVLPAPIDMDLEPAPARIQAYRGALVSVATRQGLAVIDGPDVFRRKRATNADFFDQVHPSESGHAKLGEALAEILLAVDAPG